MKFKEILDRLDTTPGPYHGRDMTETMGLGHVDLSGHGFTKRPIEIWCCTDTWVGSRAVYHDGELICITTQRARKQDLEFHWVSHEVYIRIYALIASLVGTSVEPMIDLIDFDKEVGDPSYKISYGSEILLGTRYHKEPIYQGKTVEILQVWRDDADIKKWRQVKIRVDGEEKIVDLSEISFPIKLREV